ncbi:carnitine palmitoyltransferase II [Thecamonas trahens ATCC 50062]|uniref:Carnitine palmitoyltransferase II n=1 Tax=Thecamonas trahens ATCC 50062 TaxID=461836 RepID=A0A0L0D1G3_THETB|nr:carnitine palmitoyltransferase II [Thecamonas trahens ATCC 50062]KNC46067.1 carnitine palmitoyltransferase II [Thecamonas trahens ATCC 50062]|eukprot:XP_013763047.1 carnitine palmitoyltransferase II [Thecamonas trahens ATCC 50062]
MLRLIPTPTLSVTLATAARRLTSDGYLHKTRIPTYKFQDSLPEIPIPELDATLDKYLEAVTPLASPAELKATRAAVEAFRAGPGPKLQAELLASREGVYGSYIADHWLDMYLESRAGLMIHMNPQLTLKPDTRGLDQAERAASLMVSAGRFYRTLRDGHLKPDVFPLSSLGSAWWMKALAAIGKTPVYETLLALAPRSIASKLALGGGLVPLDMSQYAHLFGTTRLPRKDKDELVCALKPGAPEPKHVSVQWGHRFFAIDIMDDAGDVLPFEDVVASIRTVLATDRTPPGSAPVGVCTSVDRDEWATTRELLANAAPGNAAALATIDAALFNVTLEHTAPRDPFEIINEHMDATGLSMHDAVAELKASPATDPFAQLKSFLHGDGTNRWFDKSFTLIVDAAANAAINFEHTWGDGLAVLRFCNEIYADSLASEPRPAADTASITELVFDTSAPELAAAIDSAATAASDVIKSLDYSAAVVPALGSTAIKSHKLSPDSTLQMALQLAYYRMHGKSGSTYEAAAMAYFKEGRTETIRSASIESDAMCATFDDPAATKADKEAAFRAAVAKHSALARDAQTGKGIDRHLFVLRRMAEAAGIDTPLFADDVYQRFATIVVSTSTLPASPALDKGGFGPVSPECFGVGYGITPDAAHFSVTTFGQDTAAFCAAVESALNDIKDAEVEAPLQRLEEGYASVDAVVVVNEHGFPLHASGLPSAGAANAVAKAMNDLSHLARNMVRDIEPDDELLFLRLRCGKTEWVVGAKEDHLVVARQNLRKLHSDIMTRVQSDADAQASHPAEDSPHPERTSLIHSGELDGLASL